MDLKDSVVVIKGGGEVGTAVAHRLARSHFRVCITEVPSPTTLCRGMAFSEAVHEGEKEVEGVVAWRLGSSVEISQVWREGKVAVVIDPQCRMKDSLCPLVLVDAIMAKRNLGTAITDAPLVIGLGLGFEAGKDVHMIVETNPGDKVGQVILLGKAQEDTGLPVAVGGHTFSRLARTSGEGIFSTSKKIGDKVVPGDVIGYFEGQPIQAQVGGRLRGLLRDGARVKAGIKLMEIDPLASQADCFQIRGMPRAIAGGVLEAILLRFNFQQGAV